MVNSKGKGELMNCAHCGNLMKETDTTFTVVKEGEVYVVEGVPCLECPVCEHISFRQEVAKKLEHYSSGRVIPVRSRRALVFRWGEPIFTISKEGFEASTINYPRFSVATSGTK